MAKCHPTQVSAPRRSFYPTNASVTMHRCPCCKRRAINYCYDDDDYAVISTTMCVCVCTFDVLQDGLLYLIVTQNRHVVQRMSVASAGRLDDGRPHRVTVDRRNRTVSRRRIYSFSMFA